MLVENGVAICTVPRESYAVLANKKKELTRYGRVAQILPIK
jgi:hypothetical protein